MAPGPRWGSRFSLFDPDGGGTLLMAPAGRCSTPTATLISATGRAALDADLADYTLPQLMSCNRPRVPRDWLAKASVAEEVAAAVEATGKDVSIGRGASRRWRPEWLVSGTSTTPTPPAQDRVGCHALEADTAFARPGDRRCMC